LPSHPDRVRRHYLGAVRRRRWPRVELNWAQVRLLGMMYMVGLAVGWILSWLWYQ